MNSSVVGWNHTMTLNITEEALVLILKELFVNAPECRLSDVLDKLYDNALEKGYCTIKREKTYSYTASHSDCFSQESEDMIYRCLNRMIKDDFFEVGASLMSLTDKELVFKRTKV